MVALIVFFPLGLVLAWKRPGWTAKTKWIVTAAVALVVIVSGVAGGTTAPQPSNTPDAAPPTQPAETSSSAPSPTPTLTPTPTPTVEVTDTPDPVPVEYARVTRVIDGDTAEVAMSDGSIERVRFIGVNSPESSDADGPKATAYTKNLLSIGRGVYLERDVEERDRYGRLLAYVWLSKPTAVNDESEIRSRMVNALLMLKGWAELLTIVPNVNYVDFFTTFQTEARNAELGIWKPTTGGGGGGGGGNCDPSYPDVCIPTPPPDLDCGDISYRNFRVIGDDPHGFDGNDNDGRGCESG